MPDGKEVVIDNRADTYECCGRSLLFLCVVVNNVYLYGTYSTNSLYGA